MDKRIKFQIYDDTIREYDINKIKIWDSKDNEDDKLIQIGKITNVLHCRYSKFNSTSILDTIKDMDVILKRFSTENDCNDRFGYCEHKTDKYNNGRYRCNDCFYNRHNKYIRIVGIINKDEIDSALKIFKKASEENQPIIVTDREKIDILYIKLKSLLDNKIIDLTKNGNQIAAFFCEVYEIVFHKHSMMTIEIIRPEQISNSIYSNYFGGHTLLYMRNKDVSAEGTNLLWGNKMKLHIVGFNLSTFEMISYSHEFCVNEDVIEKSAFVSLINKGVIKKLVLTLGREWTPKYEIR